MHLHSDIPPYAILSHRWGPDEVTLQELSDGTGLAKHGYGKIRFCGEQAWRDGLSHFWVDTCCIDKKNAVELQTAIISMFRWYHNANRCYVYLDDISYSPTQSTEPLERRPQEKRERMDTAVPTESPWHSAFRKSLWFTRGWTLQELLAPTSVEFFSKEHALLGNKNSLGRMICDITGIPAGALQNWSLSEFTLSDRFSWMESRDTLLEEDKAYAMLGIFSVQMPLLYGEGYTKASSRLRREISQAVKLPPLPVAEGATFDSRSEEHNARCYPKTRVDLLSQVESWATAPDGKAIFWLNGIAGTGKSTISRTISQHFQERGILGASFFFKRGEAERGHAGRLFTTIAAQLAAKLPYVAEQIQTAIDADPDICSKALSEQFKQLILDSLNNIRAPQTLVIIIDALDECEKDADTRVVIHLLSQVKAIPNVRLRTFLTSRPELPIRLGFQKVQASYQNLVLHQIPEHTVKHDLRVFFELELKRIHEEYNVNSFEDVQLQPDWPSEYIDVLVQRAYPLFIIAATICRFLDPIRFNSADQLRKFLDYNTTAHTSDQPASTYLPVLNQLVSEQSHITKQRLVDRFRDIVGTIILLAEPLSARALSQLLDISLPDIHNQLKLLHSVVAVPSSADAPIRIFHLSFRDFLLDRSKQDTHEFWIDEQLTHQKLAARCMQLLSTNEVLKKDICSLRNPGVSISRIGRQSINRCLPSEVQYACLYWAHHLELSGTPAHNNDQAYTFLRTHFLHWLEALCLIGSVHKSFGVIQVLRKRCAPGTYIDQFLWDSDRFIRNCGHIIEQHPLQLYCSAIAFAPHKSLIRRDFQKEMSAWIVNPPVVANTWNACTKTLEGHRGHIAQIVIAPDGYWLASASWDNAIKIWSVTMGTCIRTLDGHNDSVSTLAISPDGRWLISGSEDRTIKIWDVAIWACKQTFEKAHEDMVRSIAISPDSGWLVSASRDYPIKIWSMEERTCIQTFGNLSDGIMALAISPDGRQLISASFGINTIRIWDVTAGICQKTIKHDRNVWNVAISPDGCWFAAERMSDQTVEIRDLATGACKNTIDLNAGVSRIAISPDGCWLAIGLFDKTIQIWDAATSTCMQTLKGHTDSIFSIAISSDGRWLASGSRDTTVKIWDMTISDEKRNIENSVISITAPPGGRWQLFTFGDGTIKVWDVVASIYSKTFPCSYNLTALSPDSCYLALASGLGNEVNRSIQIWDLARGTCCQKLEGIDDHIEAIAISPDNRWLVAVSSGDTTRVQLEYGFHGRIAISPDSRSFALMPCYSTGVIEIFSLETGAYKCVLHNDEVVCSMAIAPDSLWIASGFTSGTIRICDIESGAIIHELYHSRISPVYQVSVSLNCQWLTSASRQRIVKIWDVESGACTLTLDIEWNTVNFAFDSNTSLHTDFGVINIDPAAYRNTSISQSSTAVLANAISSYQGYAIHDTLSWITWNDQLVLWLPPEYRPKEPSYDGPAKIAVTGNTIAWACASGDFLVFKLSPDGPIV
ncbi:hypothetical protein RRF57_011139 [Xylaria bambusicola]|uniref:NACHT domain-containing protein n=1 Tax=Xylaria bambusicola TaxID=326684 RepID=A0AAN7UTE0_9PEZI